MSFVEVKKCIRGGGAIFRNIVIVFCFISSCFGCVDTRNIRTEADIKHLVLGIYWRAHASLKVNDTYWNERNEWFTRYDFKDSIYNVMADGISDCVTRRGKYAGYKHGDVVEFAEKPNSTGDNYTQPNWNALVYHNFLARTIKIGGNLVDGAAEQAITRAGQAVYDKYRYQVKDVDRNINYAVEVIKDYARELYLYEFIREWNNRNWNPYMTSGECEGWRKGVDDFSRVSEYKVTGRDRNLGWGLPGYYVTAIERFVDFVSDVVVCDRLCNKYSCNTWRAQKCGLIDRIPVGFYKRNGCPYALWWKKRHIRDYKMELLIRMPYKSEEGITERIYSISILPNGELALEGVRYYRDNDKVIRQFVLDMRNNFLLPNQKYETVNKSSMSETRIVDFPNLRKGNKYETKEYSPKRIEQEAKQKSERIIRLEKYIGETYYVCNGIGHKVKEETSASLSLLGQNNISNIYNLKMSRDKTTEEYSPYRVRQELKKKGKVLTLERDTYETHYIHGGKNDLVKREVAERVRSLSRSPIQCRHY